MYVLGELGPRWADESHELYKGSCLNLFPQRTASFRPLRQMEQLFTHSPELGSPPSSLALLPSKILTSFSELLIIPPISIVLGGLCLFAPKAAFVVGLYPKKKKTNQKDPKMFMLAFFFFFFFFF